MSANKSIGTSALTTGKSFNIDTIKQREENEIKRLQRMFEHEKGLIEKQAKMEEDYNSKIKFKS